MKKLLGFWLLASPFIFITVYMVIEFGFIRAALIWLGAIVGVTIIFAGLYLMTD